MAVGTACKYVVAALVALTVFVGCGTDKSAQKEERATHGRVVGNPPADSGFAKIAIGMSQGEVVNVLGQPTEQEGGMTGKEWIPFNFKGQGTQQILMYYKGQGRIYLENESRYRSVMRVVKVEYDPNESGFARRRGR